ncbi:hypothetical protein GCK72_018141 [Caenorhabditis remanei]|uniref:Alpha-mannosidase n=1 Tax=Caenorhabditis remanei TaxID=31234 RepID=A0A6A5G943_CAERE|nr:hypothetical protein GCK72_018141 [Caenorhabditis remanei]KAF1751587.1 hypothetical protein GCK72_018141 [Caenorhabditis remanei]
MGKRNFYIILSLGVFLTVSLYLYNGIETGAEAIAKRQQYVDELRRKIGSLEQVAEQNGKTIDRLEQQVRQVKVEKSVDFDEDKDKTEEKEQEQEVAPVPVRGNRGNEGMAHIHQVQKHHKPTPPMTDICNIRENISVAHSDLQMLDLYDTWKFENLDGGVWKQGWKIEYDAVKVKALPRLEVIVIPHSHCDPGWIMTFDEYYSRQTRNILNGMAKHLGEKDEMRFIYAEISFFETWWREQSEETRKKVKGYLEAGKLEIVTGGWVMTDEANAHYHSMVTELFEGHEWIQNHLGKNAIPKSHWSIDPFGLSPSLPHLLTSANITNAVLQRVHYSVKRELALKKNLEFYWRQLFGSTGHPDLRSHIMPFYSYDIPHTCGPEPSVCCQFDFRRMPDGGKSCDWGIPPQRITDENVAERAQMIYDQYRKKSQLFKNSVIFQPLGDDFRYDIDFEWNSQYENYKKLFEYMNSKSEWNVHAQFGTLSDYFKKLDTAISESGEKLPTLSGDFFTYADRDDHYWSGYFTSRPFYKQLDRVLQHYLRSAEIAFSLANIEEEGMMESKVFGKLVTARRALSLFQHHDGVTGTAKDHVVLDYGQKMIDALNACEDVLSESLVVLLGIDSTKKMEMDEKRVNENLLPEKRAYKVGQNVVLFNTLSRNRNEPVCIRVDSVDAGIEAEPPVTKQQISPVIEYNEESKKLVVKDGVFELCFLASLGPMESVSLKLVKSTTTSKSEIRTNSKIQVDSSFKSSSVGNGDFIVQNDKVKAEFDGENGMIKKATSLVDDKPIDLNSHFVHYGARKARRKFANGNEDNPAGAYLFLPDGEARELKKEENEWIVIEGDLVRRVFATPMNDLKILQTYTLYQGLPWIDLDNEVDVRSKENFELALRFSTSISSNDEFFTDLNGLQMIKRRRQTKLPTQANFYPMSAGVYIEDDASRMTIHSAQALGVSSLASGQIEIMLDRRLSSDDNRGLQQGVRDNKRTVAHFRIVIEPMSPTSSNKKDERVGFHSHVGHLATWSLHYPVVKMMGETTPKSIASKNLEQELNCDLHVVTFRTLASPTTYEANERSTAAEKKAAMVMHRVVPDCRSRLSLPDTSCLTSGIEIEPLKLISSLKSARQTSLTNLYEGQKSEQFKLQPNDVSSILVSF